jgi:citrate lyase subunit alpha/citrate CoA-transferase
MENILGRYLPDQIDGYGTVRPYGGLSGTRGGLNGMTCRSSSALSHRSKVLPDVLTALKECGVQDGATLSFHHHLRNGDNVLNMVLQAASDLGLKGLTIAASSIFPVHAPMVEHIRKGVVTGIYTAYAVGPVADAISAGHLENVAVLQTHGGRARAIESGELPIDIAFVAAPTSDDFGNVNGAYGPSACGTLGYALVDVRHARHVVAVTDNLAPYPTCPADITQDFVDFVVVVPSIGDASQIVSGTTRVTEDPVGLAIAATAADVIAAGNLLSDGFSFQTGAGGISLAVAEFVGQKMQAAHIKGSFAAGGVTGKIVEMLNAGLFRSLFDVQCFDLAAIRSYRENPAHRCMSASLYASPWTRGAVVDRLDAMILGAAEVDLDFNVNVTTRSNGTLLGGSGGHSDTAAGAKLAIVTTRLKAGAFPKIVERVTTATTPGSSIDVVVTEAGVAVNPGRPELRDHLVRSGISVLSIQRLHDLANSGMTKTPDSKREHAKIVALQQYRDGTIIDVLKQTNAHHA